MTNNTDSYLPYEAEIIERIQESPSIFTLGLRFTDQNLQKKYLFQPGQFNMLYCYGVGEVPISIVSDPDDNTLYNHTIRTVGRVTRSLAQLKAGDRIGVRGPYGQGWPIEKALGKDIVIVTGGLGCAPVVALINYITERRTQFGKLIILQGVKHSDDFIFKKRYERWKKEFQAEIYIAADRAGGSWPWYTGRVTDMIHDLTLNAENTIAMLCGPEIMMSVAAKELLNKNMDEQAIYLSMERNMECALGHCGHCQYGGLFICKNGPVLAYSRIKPLFGKAGF